MIEFGVSVEVSDQYVLVGASGTESDSTASGSVWLFTEVAGEFVEKELFESPEKSVHDLYGSCLQAVSSSQFLVSAPRAHSQEDNSGAVYSYVKEGEQWLLRQKIVSPREITEGFFGCSISFSENRLLIGAFQERTDTIISGAAYCYQMNEQPQFELRERIVPKDASDHDYFGLSVSLSGNQALVSSPKFEHKKAFRDIGCVDIFTITDEAVELVAKILPEDGMADDHFGLAFAASETDLLIGSRFNGNMFANDGASYFYNIRQAVGVDLEVLSNQTPMLLKLSPNPFLYESTLYYQLEHQGRISIKVYNLNGQLVRSLIDKNLPSGLHQVIWDGKDDKGQILPAGSYTCQIVAGIHVESIIWIKG